MVLRLAFEGTAAQTRLASADARKLCRQHKVTELGLAVPEEFWATHHAAAEGWTSRIANGRRAARVQARVSQRGFDYLHTAIPQDQVRPFRRWCNELLVKHGLHATEYGIWGRSDLFSVAIGDWGSDVGCDVAPVSQATLEHA